MRQKLYHAKQLSVICGIVHLSLQHFLGEAYNSWSRYLSKTNRTCWRCSWAFFENIKISSTYTMQNRSMYPFSTSFIIIVNVSAALQKPIGELNTETDRTWSGKPFSHYQLVSIWSDESRFSNQFLWIAWILELNQTFHPIVVSEFCSSLLSYSTVCSQQLHGEAYLSA